MGLGAGGSQITEFDDGNLAQVLEVRPFARRALVLGSSEGVYFGLIQIVFDDAGDLLGSQTLNIYDPNAIVAGVARPLWPSPIEEGFDVWLLAVSCNVNQGDPGFAGGLQLNLPITEQAMGIQLTKTGEVVAPISGSVSIPLVLWPDIGVGIGVRQAIDQAGNTRTIINRRLKRGNALQLFAIAGVAGLIITANMEFGLFKTGLGQDAAF